MVNTNIFYHLKDIIGNKSVTLKQKLINIYDAELLIYPVKIEVVFVEDEKQFKEVLSYFKKQYKLKSIQENLYLAGACIIPHNNFADFIIIFNKITSNIGIISHEVEHLVNFIYNDLSIQHSFTNDEPTAFFKQFLVNTICAMAQREKYYFNFI
jgi:hypothetical protein